MKKFNLFAIGVVAMLMAAVNVSAANPVTGEKKADGYENLAACLTAADETKCTLADDEQKLTGTVTKNITIVTAGHPLLINENLTVNEGVKLTISGGHVSVKGTNVKVTLNENSTLLITGNDSKDYRALTLESKSTFDIKDGATLSVSDNAKNKGGAFAVLSAAKTSEITLESANLVLNNNNGYGLNGAETLKIVADHSSEIQANNNSTNGVGADFELKHGSKVTATGNGYAGVTFGTTTIDATSKVEATDNLKSTDEVVNKKGDVVLQGKTTVNGGTITAGSVAPLSITWKNQVGEIGQNQELEVEGNNVSFTELKKICQDSNALTCNNAVDISEKIKAVAGKSAVIKAGKTGYVYGTANEITTDDTVEEVVITESAEVSRVSVAAGTKITNMSTENSVLAHVTGENSLVEIPKATLGTDGKTLVPASTTVGTKAPEEKDPAEGDNNPAEDQKPADTTPEKDPAENPDTLDNVTSVAAMGGISLAIAAAGIVTLKKREN